MDKLSKILLNMTINKIIYLNYIITILYLYLALKFGLSYKFYNLQNL